MQNNRDGGPPQISKFFHCKSPTVQPHTDTHTHGECVPFRLFHVTVGSRLAAPTPSGIQDYFPQFPSAAGRGARKSRGEGDPGLKGAWLREEARQPMPPEGQSGRVGLHTEPKETGGTAQSLPTPLVPIMLQHKDQRDSQKASGRH